MNKKEYNLVEALMYMCLQYMGDPSDPMACSAGEDALSLLEEYKMAIPTGKGTHKLLWESLYNADKEKTD